MPMEFIGNIGNLFSPDYRYQAAFSFSNVLAVPLANVALLVVIILWAARRIHLKTVKQLNDVPQMREHFPFQFLWIVAKTCYQPNFTVGFSTLLFAAVSGLHVAFQRHGRFLMYIGFKPWLCVFKAEYVEEVLSSNKILTKGQEYGLLHSWLGTGLLTSSGEKWRSRRRLLTPSFHFRILEDFMPTINKESMILAKKLGQRSRENETLDVVPLIALCTLDIICETIMGSTISAQTNEHSPYVIAVKRIGELFVERVLKPILQIDFIYRWTPMGREYRRCLHTLHSFTRKLIAERKQTLRKEVDSGLISLEHDSSEVGRKKAWPFLDLLLLEHFKNNITEEGIREEVDTFMFEGHDTTAIGISWALFLIGHHPKEQLIHEELDLIFGKPAHIPVRATNHQNLHGTFHRGRNNASERLHHPDSPVLPTPGPGGVPEARGVPPGALLPGELQGTPPVRLRTFLGRAEELHRSEVRTGGGEDRGGQHTPPLSGPVA
ncbi:cytochrome P450 4c3-like isoform X2 [Amblyomma americanum]